MADTLAGHKFYICTTPKPDDLNQAAFEALTWVLVSGVGQLPESGENPNILSYNTVDTVVTQKGKGVSDAGDSTMEVARDYNDAGQVALRAAAATKFQYAFKHEYTDAPDEDTTNTIVYHRGIISGPRRSGGGPDDFVLETYSLGFNQADLVVGPTAIP